MELHLCSVDNEQNKHEAQFNLLQFYRSSVKTWHLNVKLATTSEFHAISSVILESKLIFFNMNDIILLR